MNKYIFKDGAKVTACSALADASADELRILMALIDSSPNALSDEDIRKISGAPASRVRAALVLWESEGIIYKQEGAEGTVSEEFDTVVRRGEIEEEEALQVAKNIRDEELCEMLDICAKLMGKPALSTTEVKNLTALVSQYSLTPEFVVMLATYLSEHGKLTAVRLRDRAISLVEKSVDTTEALEVYLNKKESETAAEKEFKRIFGSFSRESSDAEKALFKKWDEEFGFSTAIVKEAYSISTLNTGKLSLKYMDKILSAWHARGCTTLEECRAASNVAQAKEQAPQKRAKAKTEAEKPRYGNFDVEDAFQKALSRSFEGLDEED